MTALHGIHQTPLDAANDLRRKRATLGDVETAADISSSSGFSPRRRYSVAESVMAYSLVVALAALSIFAVLNLLAK